MNSALQDAAQVLSDSEVEMDRADPDTALLVAPNGQALRQRFMDLASLWDITLGALTPSQVASIAAAYAMQPDHVFDTAYMALLVLGFAPWQPKQLHGHIRDIVLVSIRTLHWNFARSHVKVGHRPIDRDVFMLAMASYLDLTTFPLSQPAHVSAALQKVCTSLMPEDVDTFFGKVSVGCARRQQSFDVPAVVYQVDETVLSSIQQEGAVDPSSALHMLLREACPQIHPRLHQNAKAHDEVCGATGTNSTHHVVQFGQFFIVLCGATGAGEPPTEPVRLSLRVDI